MSIVLLTVGGASAQAQDGRQFAAHALAFRSAAVDGTSSAVDVLAVVPGAGAANAQPLLWRPFFENAIVKLGRVRSWAPVALYYNPLADLALLTFWERRETAYQIVSIRALPGERLNSPGAFAPEYPGWLEADDGVAALAGTTRRRLTAFRRAHPAEAPEAGRDGATFHAAASDMRAARPRLTWLLAVRAQWAAAEDSWLFGALAAIDEALGAGRAAAILAAAPDTDAATASALSELPSRYTERLTLDLTLEVGGPDRLLIASSVDDGDIYVFVVCRLDGGDCGLRRLVLLSLAGVRSPG